MGVRWRPCVITCPPATSILFMSKETVPLRCNSSKPFASLFAFKIFMTRKMRKVNGNVRTGKVETDYRIDHCCSQREAVPLKDSGFHLRTRNKRVTVRLRGSGCNQGDTLKPISLMSLLETNLYNTLETPFTTQATFPFINYL